MAEMPESGVEGSGRNLRDTTLGASSVTARREDYAQGLSLMEAVVERENMMKAYQRVLTNKGSSGVDGMSVELLKPHLQEHWPIIKESLLRGSYQPRAVRAVEIPKPDGGIRKLGIPTVVDRMIQQAIHQVLEPIFDTGFSESSYGFRRGRSAHQAVKKAREYVKEGRRWVVDIDLEKFFDRVNHDILMAQVARKVKDKRILGLIRRYLQAGILMDGLLSARTEGTPQGSPLSPMLSNIMLDDLDKELERRGHKFCRYADDANIYVKSERAGTRVMQTVTRFLEGKLKLKVNPQKSHVERPWKVKFLGYSMTPEKTPRLRVAKQSLQRLKQRLRETFCRGRGKSLKQLTGLLNPLLRGWVEYFRCVEVRLIFEELDGWIRRKLRNILWRQWKRGQTRFQNLQRLGLDTERARSSAWNGRGPWWNSGASHMNQALPKAFFDRLGLASLTDLYLMKTLTT